MSISLTASSTLNCNHITLNWIYQIQLSDLLTSSAVISIRHAFVSWIWQLLWNFLLPLWQLNTLTQLTSANVFPDVIKYYLWRCNFLCTSGHCDDTEGKAFSEPHWAFLASAGAAAQHQQIAVATWWGENTAGMHTHTQITFKQKKSIKCIPNNISIRVSAGGPEERGPWLQVFISCLFHAQKPSDAAAAGSRCLWVPLPAGRLMNVHTAGLVRSLLSFIICYNYCFSI